MQMVAGLIFALLWAMSFSLIVLFLAARMLAVGLAVTPDDLRALLRRRGAVVRALLANVVAVPALAVLLALALPLSNETRLAILLLASVPGGMDLLGWRADRAGERGDSAALVFLLSVVAIAFVPMMRVPMQQVGPHTTLSYGRLIVVVGLGVLLPLLAGLAIRRAAPGLARVLGRVAAAVAAVLFVVVLLAVGIVSSVQRYPLGLIDVLAMVMFVLGAGAIGWLLGGPPPATRPVLAHLTAMRNVGLALLLATVGVPSPGTTLAVAVLAVGLVVLGALLAWLDLARRRRPSMDHAVPSA